MPGFAWSEDKLPPASFPEAEISNGTVHAKLYLPDPEKGYYRGTRFDWSGVIADLTYENHHYFGKWFDRYDPKLHDAISGPVEEFSSLGYDNAKTGETFVRIGVGVVKKPEESSYRFTRTYDLVDGGTWTVHKKRDRVEFIHKLKDKSGSGYSYIYKKTVRLAKNKPELILEHSLKNIGWQPIDANVYNHNFFVIDNQPSGPEFSVKFPFEVRATGDLKNLAETQGTQIRYLRELEKGQSTYTELEGFGKSAKDYDITVENRKSGAGVRVIGDRPLSRLVFWSIRTTLCPEAYIHLRIEPGSTTKWQAVYNFYTLPHSKAE